MSLKVHDKMQCILRARCNLKPAQQARQTSRESMAS